MIRSRLRRTQDKSIREARAILKQMTLAELHQAGELIATEIAQRERHQGPPAAAAMALGE